MNDYDQSTLHFTEKGLPARLGLLINGACIVIHTMTATIYPATIATADNGKISNSSLTSRTLLQTLSERQPDPGQAPPEERRGRLDYTRDRPSPCSRLHLRVADSRVALCGDTLRNAKQAP